MPNVLLIYSVLAWEKKSWHSKGISYSKCTQVHRFFLSLFLLNLASNKAKDQSLHKSAQQQILQTAVIVMDKEKVDRAEAQKFVLIMKFYATIF